ncbi:putative G-type lectin S-receptor-like serine/threonine-protein kinase SD1-1-like [Capsicum annuum]|nr:putative G-type lectin S-receptor-like serine/threonine-protein kinase SD1-1-like [Capsicum annuum]KAF3654932.1 putative G-type lectin S-receptor-like serine/threonine-protein kinase SD1-1-like [Capsicum annuum]
MLMFLSSIGKCFGVTSDTITTTHFLKDGEDNVIVSRGGTFEMGFFSPGNSKNRYVGMWYKNISVRTVVWVANREVPLTSRTGSLKVIEPGILVLVNGTNIVVWSTNTSRSVQNPIAQLLDSGNLVVKQAGDGSFLWQSFDHPTNTLFPGVKLGWNFVTGREVYLSSWKNEEDPAPGDYTYRCDPSGYPQNFLKKGSTAIYRSGPWNGLRFGGATNSRYSTFYKYGVVSINTEVYFQYNLTSTVITMLILNPNGVAQLLTWGDGEQAWVPFLVLPGDNCDTYKLCGSYGSCNSNDFPVLCGCLDKFVPNNSEAWNKADWSDTRNSWSNVTMTLEECKNMCSKNCSCMAYSNADIRDGGSGCLLWFNDLLDIRQVPKGGLDFYIRVAASESDDNLEQSNGKKGKALIWILASSVGVILVILSMLIYHRRRKKVLERKKKVQTNLLHLLLAGRLGHTGNCAEEFEIPLFDLSTVAKATNNFSVDVKIGEGGFGPVYKGMLEGQEIAVKRLSRTSTQGENEFMNEVLYIAKLQHRNLVKIIGCCIEGEEKMLIYEYMPNGSLDSFIFDDTQNKVLDWPKRFHIINSIARGIMYLHQDSQLRIIHRDLKANNILLDKDMNPKISDFGLAKICEEDVIEAKTSRVVGTRGYLSPEYALQGLYSVKSDVFSFGILVLEIVSGKSNRRFSHPDHYVNLLGHAWKTYKEGRSIELLEECLSDTCSRSEVVRSICVGLLCVQQCPEDRPSMSSVVFMLNNEGVLPQAKPPGFYIERNTNEVEFSSNQHANVTVNLLWLYYHPRVGNVVALPIIESEILSLVFWVAKVFALAILLDIAVCEIDQFEVRSSFVAISLSDSDLKLMLRCHGFIS